MEEFQCWRLIVDEFKVKTPTLDKFGLGRDEIDAYLPVAMVPVGLKMMPQILIDEELVGYGQGEANNVASTDVPISSDFQEMEDTSENILFSSCGVVKSGKDTSQIIMLSQCKIYDMNSEIDIEAGMMLSSEEIIPETDVILSSELSSDLILQSVS